MLELYKGQIMLEKIMHELPYKEAIRLRDVRVKRLESERAKLEEEREAEAARQKAAERASKIIVPPASGGRRR